MGEWIFWEFKETFFSRPGAVEGGEEVAHDSDKNFASISIRIHYLATISTWPAYADLILLESHTSILFNGK